MPALATGFSEKVAKVRLRTEDTVTLILRSENTNMSASLRNSLTCVELCAGAGGLSMGLKRAGFRHLLSVEFDVAACAMLEYAIPLGTARRADVRDVDWTDISRPDLVAGGIPCQPWSAAGRAAGPADARNLWPEAVRALREMRPRAFLFENVRGFLRPGFTDAVNLILDALSLDGTYEVSVHRANAADYGTPQHRHRVFVVGLPPGVSFVPPARTHARDGAGGLIPWRTVRQAIGHLPPSGPGIPGHAVRAKAARPYPGHTGSVMDEPSKALKAGVHGVPGGENMLCLDDGNYRYMTAREAALLMDFPADHPLHPVWGTALRQLGNAVPVRLAEAFGGAVARALMSNRSLAR